MIAIANGLPKDMRFRGGELVKMAVRERFAPTEAAMDR
jgi:hypothetical protein